MQASTLSEIQQLVEHGLEQRPRYARLAERVASWFIAAILVIAIATAWYWLQQEPSRWLASTIAVLIVTCPCALALATPVALAVSAGRFVEKGVLPLRIQALDDLAKSDLFVFDKTGTLTEGHPALSAVHTTGDFDRQQCLRYAAALSADSEHPLAQALRLNVPQADVRTDTVKNVPGSGISAMIGDQEWRLGKPGFAEQGHRLSSEVTSIIEDCQSSGQLVSLLSNRDGIQAILTFEDPLRCGVQEMLTGLSKTGVDTFAILSGDSRSSVSKLCRRLGIGDCHGGMSPRDKLAWTRGRQQQGHRIAMLGDGINDAPTLAAADVSISFSEASDLANISSDFLILGDDASTLVSARRLARQTRLNIIWNFTWAASYNLVAVPFAAAGYIPPWLAAIGMSASSLIVVLNALRLKRA